MPLPRTEELKELALKYSKQQLGQLAMRGEVDPMTAVMAGMMRDRIVMDEMRQNAPTTTVMEDVLAPQDQPTGVAGAPRDQLAQMQQPVAGQPQMAMQGAAAPMQAQMPAQMASGGLASIDVPEELYETYAGGGLVAFSDGGPTRGGNADRLRREAQAKFRDDPETLRRLPSLNEAQLAELLGTARPNTPGPDFIPAPPPEGMNMVSNPKLAQSVQDYQNLMGSVPKGEGEVAYQDYLKNLPEVLGQRRKEDMWTALTQFGLNMAATKSPTLLQAAGEAGTAALPTVQEAIKSKRAGEETAMRSRAEMDRAERAEKIRGIEGGTRLYGEEATRQQQREISEATLANQREIAAMNRQAQLEAARVTASKPTDMRSYVDTYVRSMRAQGDKETPDEVLQQRGYESYMKQYSAAGTRAEAAVTQAGTAADKAAVDLADKARGNVDKTLNMYNSPQAAKMRELRQQDRKNRTSTAEAYMQELYEQEENRLRAAGSGESMATRPPTAAGAPTTATAPQSTIPSAAIQMLKNNPTDEAKRQFDQVFGAGAAARVLGNR